ncbi:hypothetical protein FOMPIDRAFT_115654 [Fomitopsis schrenkii]|uniref:Uncharacterized protein n=1 Tax=Fomitopsis schrenkii TaxID=2126942 RepID=S8E9X9_FOMSC|nr:hypothetical protein FOMPIDRAFT_115654 [Fomitopsis schrenkii]
MQSRVLLVLFALFFAVLFDIALASPVPVVNDRRTQKRALKQFEMKRRDGSIPSKARRAEPSQVWKREEPSQVWKRSEPSQVWRRAEPSQVWKRSEPSGVWKRSEPSNIWKRAPAPIP